MWLIAGAGIGWFLFLVGAVGLQGAATRLMVLTWAFGVFVAESSVFGGEAVGFQTPAKVVPFVALAVLTAVLLRGGKRGTADGALRQTLHQSRPLRAVGLYLGWLILAALLAPDPALSVLRVGQAVVPIAAAVAYARVGKPDRLMSALVVATGAHLVLSQLSPTLVGRLGEEREVGYLVANSFAVAASLPLVITVGRIVSGRAGAALVLPLIVPLSFYGLSVSRGRTATLATLLGILVIALSYRARGRRSREISRRRILMLTGIGLAIPIALMSYASSFTEWFIRGDTSEVSTLTGRTDVWPALAAPVVEHRPLTGYGPGAVRLEAIPDIPEEYRTLGSAHNSLVEALTSGGLVGAVLWLWMMWTVGVAALRSRASNRPLVLGLFAAVGVLSSTLGNLAGFGMAWYAFAALLAELLPSGVTLDRRRPPSRQRLADARDSWGGPPLGLSDEAHGRSAPS